MYTIMSTCFSALSSKWPNADSTIFVFLFAKTILIFFSFLDQVACFSILSVLYYLHSVNINYFYWLLFVFLYSCLGEIFGGIQMSSDSNDTEILMQHLGLCCSRVSSPHNKTHTSGERQSSVPELLSRIKGPWALIYWQVTFCGKFLLAYFSRKGWIILKQMLLSCSAYSLL